MKMCVIVHQFPVVSETFIIDHIEAMSARGHELDVVVEPGPDVDHGLLGRIPDARRPHVEYVRERPSTPGRRCWMGAKLFGELAFRAPTRAIRSLNVLSYGREAANLRILFGVSVLKSQTRKYDLIHCHFGTSGVLGLALRDMGALSGALVTHFHGYDISRYTQKLGGRFSYRSLYRRGDLFLAVSNLMRQRLIDLGADPGRVAIQRYGVDTRMIRPVSRGPRNQGAFRVMSVARLVEKKGLSYGLRAIADVVRRGVVTEYTIVGAGPLYQSLRELTRSLGLDDYVTFLGSRPHEEVIRLLGQHDVLLAPSVTAEDGDQEGNPVTIIEAMALGLPVVSTLHSGIPETVEHGVTGFLAPERNVPDLAEALLSLALQPSLRDEMGRRARKYAERNLDREALFDDLEGIYDNLLSSGS